MLWYMSSLFIPIILPLSCDQIIYKKFVQTIKPYLDTGFQNGRYPLSTFVIDFIVIVIKFLIFLLITIQGSLLFCHKPYINGEFTLDSYIILRKTFFLSLLQLIHLGI